jgi:hypothetical protein
MWVMKKKQIHIDAALLLILLAVVCVGFFGSGIIEYICTHNILKGQW